MPPELPPSPPPPPMLCATMPRDAVFVVTMLPKFSTVTAPPLPALAPLPPIATRPPAFEPLPPLPPTDCAKMPSDWHAGRRDAAGAVVDGPSPCSALPPFDPDPPRAIRPPALPPVPPPPPMLCAKMPRDCATGCRNRAVVPHRTPPRRCPPLSPAVVQRDEQISGCPGRPSRAADALRQNPVRQVARGEDHSGIGVRDRNRAATSTVSRRCRTDPTSPHWEPPSPPLLLTLRP